jgi:chromosome segregation ATPase
MFLTQFFAGQQQYVQNERHLSVEMDAINRETLQLERQQSNLRIVLQSMREWPKKQQSALQENSCLQTEISQTKNKIEHTASLLADQRKLEADLHRQIAEIQRQLQTMEPTTRKIEDDAELRGLRAETDSIEASIRQKKQRLDDLAAKVTENLPLINPSGMYDRRAENQSGSQNTVPTHNIGIDCFQDRSGNAKHSTVEPR